MSNKPTIIVPGMEKGVRVDSRILEERIQKAVHDGHRTIEILANGQHGIGGRLWSARIESVMIRVMGTSGQRLGSMGFPNTFIDALGPVSDDVGWLNAGAEIVVRGNATNGVGNAMAQGKIYISGDTGARAMTMTKHNPRFDPPELWVLGSVGDSFAEFMAGGIAVVCGHDTPRTDNILGYRPCVGMVGGKIFFRGSHGGYSAEDARITKPDDDEWQWLTFNMKGFLDIIDRKELYPLLTGDREQWQLLVARRPHEKFGGPSRRMNEFRKEIWNRELGPGGLIGDLSDMDRSPIDVITTGILRRYVPVWENDKYLPPCQAHCPTGIPVQKRWELIRKGMIEKAVDLALSYTPFPATVCGYLCPNLCMEHCTRQTVHLPSVDVSLLGRASMKAQTPEPAPKTGKKIAVIGGGASGLSVAWQLWMKGHEPVIFEMRDRLGGKITDMIPRSRIPDDVVEHELNRVREQITHINMKHPLTQEELLHLKETYDFIVIAIGAQKPRMIPVPGNERAIAALDFLRQSRIDNIKVGKNVVVIGAGNVGCDAAAEAVRLGAQEVTLIDIQEPASYGKERKAAEAAGAKFLWPRFTKAITEEGVLLADGAVLPADTVIVSIGDQPDVTFLPDSVAIDKGFIVVDDHYQSSDPQIFAIGDAVKLGLLTDAIGAGRLAAHAIDDVMKGRYETFDKLPPIDPDRVKMEYYDPRTLTFDDPVSCASLCASCGACRDCSVCEALCPRNAISRLPLEGDAFEYRVDDDKCIGCGFCVSACPTGVWRLKENDPLE
jgi:NADPH-dependent glutamate synthase beta subunit-like oxidoreductase/glutamate synthase domain-containing protein 3/NAD-dependent dihydropyrimidine dehydrogenase PreA subunit